MKYKVNDSCIGCRRSLFRRTFQPQHHWFCHRFCADDGIGCGDGVIVFCGKHGNYILLQICYPHGRTYYPQRHPYRVPKGTIGLLLPKHHGLR